MVNNRLWAIGGYAIDSVEVIDINTTNITRERWHHIGRLNSGIYCFGVTAVDKTIFVVGGYRTSSHEFSSTVQTIDAGTNVIVAHEDILLPYTVAGMSVVAIDHTIYGFGGQGRVDNETDYKALDSIMTLKTLRDFPSSECFLFSSWQSKSRISN